jgi:hypothetical protein
MAGLYIGNIQSTATDFGKGSQRDLLDSITMVDAKETPFMAMVPKGSAPINALFEWPVDVAETPGDNAVYDGTDLADGDYVAGEPTNQYDVMANRVQWFRRQAKIGKLAQNVQNQAGIKNHYAYSVTKKLLQLKRDAEVRLCSANIRRTTGDTLYYSAKVAVDSGSGSTTANKTRGLGEFVNPGASESTHIPSGYLTPAASYVGGYHNGTAWAGTDTTEAGALTESQVESVLQSIYEQTGKTQTLTLLSGTNVKKRFKDFTQTQFGSDGTTNIAAASAIRSYNADLKDKRIISTVDVYEGDFGTLELVPTLWNYYNFTGGTGTIDTNAATRAKGTAYVIDWDLLELRFNQLPQVTELPDLGGGRRFAVDMIAGLCVKNPLGLGAFFCK